ncbi:TIGR02281 family clan AA aspartic protease, partial [Pseudomonas sp. HMWF010]
GQPVRFLVDTGATDTVLTPDDARRLGIDVDEMTFDRQAETANGPGFGAPWTAERFEVGGIRLRDFPVTVNKTPMSASLLGLSFLDRLESFEARRQTLTLRWRDEAG